jgi:hypothetical protein
MTRDAKVDAEDKTLSLTPLLPVYMWPLETFGQVREAQQTNTERTMKCPRCGVNEYLVAGVDWQPGDPLWGGAWHEHPDLNVCRNCDEIQTSGFVISLRSQRRLAAAQPTGAPLDSTHPYYKGNL